jgi:SET domain-containing protein
MLDEQDDRFYVGPSRIPGAGDGVFSRVPVRAGDRLAVIGVTIRADSPADRCTRYADEYKYRVGDTLVIPVGYGAMVNHSTSPNMAKVHDRGGLYLEALRDIDADEEISFAYDPRALDRFGPSRI